MRLSLLILISLCYFRAHPQPKAIPILERRINLSCSNEKITTVLNRIGQLASFSFSYNSSIISEDQVVTIKLKDKTVGEVLNEIFRGSMNYKDKGNHLILTKVQPKQVKSSSTSLIISGYVEDAWTKEGIVEASVYDKKSISSVVTDEFGFFRLKLEKKEEVPMVISISKKNYHDTTIAITGSGNQYSHISLQPLYKMKDTTITSAPLSLSDTASIHSSLPTDSSLFVKPDQEIEEELVLPYNTAPNVENISDTLYRGFQVSLLPFVGTNGPLSGNIVNDYSFNLFGGYSLGTRQAELGAFFNFDRADVSWLQVAGFGNIVGRNVYGVQASGFFNANGGETKAVQATGFVNVNFGDFKGVQLSGFVNMNMGAADGVLATGFINYSNGNSTGVQAAGFANIHLQDFDGLQVAGLTNINTGTIRGSQIAGFFNHGKKVYGTQIGFVNYADSLTGIPIGFLSYVRHGYHKLELSGNEIFYANVAFRSGVRQFYNILTASFKPENVGGQNNVWAFGYGLGTARKLTPWLFMNIDITSEQVNKNGFTAALSYLNKVHLGFDFQLAKKFSIYAGATLNGHLTRTFATDYPVLFTDHSPQIIFDDTISGDVNLKMWWGVKAGVRLF